MFRLAFEGLITLHCVELWSKELSVTGFPVAPSLFGVLIWAAVLLIDADKSIRVTPVEAKEFPSQ